MISRAFSFCSVAGIGLCTLVSVTHFLDTVRVMQFDKQEAVQRACVMDQDDFRRQKQEQEVAITKVCFTAVAGLSASSKLLCLKLLRD